MLTSSVTRKTTHKKKKVLVICSPGARRERRAHGGRDQAAAAKDPKFDKKEALTSIVEIAQLAGCHLGLYFEARKMRDLYLWAGRIDADRRSAPGGAGAADARLRLTGNRLLGSRLLSFDGGFNAALALLQQLLAAIFSLPKGHPRSKPFHDHVLFKLLEGRVLVRYSVGAVTGRAQALWRARRQRDARRAGPRFALVPIRLLSECSRETIFANEASSRQTWRGAAEEGGRGARSAASSKERASGLTWLRQAARG